MWCLFQSQRTPPSIPFEQSSLWWGKQILKVFSPPVFRSETLFKRIGRQLPSKRERFIQTSSKKYIFTMVSKQGWKKRPSRVQLMQFIPKLLMNEIIMRVPFISSSKLARFFWSAFREGPNTFFLLSLEWSDRYILPFLRVAKWKPLFIIRVAQHKVSRVYFSLCHTRG